MLIAVLPFAKGKDIEIILLPKEEILRLAVFDVGYYFPLYLSQLLLGIAVYTSFRLYKFAIFTKQITIAMCVFCLFILVATIPSLYSQFSAVIMLSAIELVLCFVVFVLPKLLKVSRRTLQLVNHTLCASVLFQTTWVLAQVYNQGPLGRDMEARSARVFFTEGGNAVRFSGTFFEASILGTFMLMHVVYFSQILVHKQYTSLAEKWIYVVTILAALVAIAFTGSRGIYAITVLYGLYFLWKYNSGVIRIVRSTNKTIAGIVLTLFLLLVSPYIYARFSSIPTLFTPQGSGTYRIQIAQYAIRLAERNIFGVGLNLSPYYFATAFSSEQFVFDPSHPHNILFQILAEMGPFGLCVFLFFLWLLYRPLYVKKIPDDVIPYATASLSFLLAAQFYPIFISQPEILSFFFLYAGIMRWKMQNKSI